MSRSFKLSVWAYGPIWSPSILFPDLTRRKRRVKEEGGGEVSRSGERWSKVEKRLSQRLQGMNGTDWGTRMLSPTDFSSADYKGILGLGKNIFNFLRHFKHITVLTLTLCALSNLYCGHILCSVSPCNSDLIHIYGYFYYLLYWMLL